MKKTKVNLFDSPQVIKTKQFKKAYKKYKYDALVINALNSIIELLLEREPLPKKFKDHELIGKFKGIRECHLQPDTLLLYFTVTEEGILKLYDIGTHSEIFK